MFPNIKNMQFDQSSPVQPNPEKKSGQNFPAHKENHLFLKTEIFEKNTFSQKNAIILVFQNKN